VTPTYRSVIQNILTPSVARLRPSLNAKRDCGLDEPIGERHDKLADNMIMKEPKAKARFVEPNWFGLGPGLTVGQPQR
jgi:hypothetical protein